MKIKRKKKNDRTAFFFMNALAYFKYRLAINPERRLDKTLPAETKHKRDRDRAAWMTKQFKTGPGIPIEQLFLNKPDEISPH